MKQLGIDFSRLDEVPLRTLVSNRGPITSSEGKLDGLQLDPRAVAAAAYAAGPKWKDADVLAMATMVSLAESLGYLRAYCDNFKDNADGTRTLLSRDCGIWQINILAKFVGTKTEEDLYDPVKNARAAYALYDRRKWQPWVAFDTGVCFHDPYLQRGVLGVMNFLAEKRIADAKGKKAWQTTEVPIFLSKQLPYTKKPKT